EARSSTLLCSTNNTHNPNIYNCESECIDFSKWSIRGQKKQYSIAANGKEPERMAKLTAFYLVATYETPRVKVFVCNAEVWCI
ncbi:MAG: hypothetical protein ABJA18_09980, partial [bacterium]